MMNFDAIPVHGDPSIWEMDSTPVVRRATALNGTEVTYVTSPEHDDYEGVGGLSFDMVL